MFFMHFWLSNDYINSSISNISIFFSNIRVVPVGMSKSVKKLIKATVPDMSKYNDVSEYMTK